MVATREPADRGIAPQIVSIENPAGIIRRNTLLLASTQALVGIGQQLTPALGAIMVERLLGSVALAGLSTSLLNVSRLVVAYPVGWAADTYGRKVPMLAGHVLSASGAVTVGMSMVLQSFPVFVLGVLLFGTGAGAIQQLRLAAADMYPPARRAEGLGYVLTGSLVGAVVAPGLVSGAQWLAPSAGLDPIAMAWLMVPLVVLPSLFLVTRIRPDPRDIAANLAAYYPTYQGMLYPSRPADGSAPAEGLRTWIRHYPLMTAFITNFGAQGTMSLMMAMTSLALAHHGHVLPAISLSVSIHVVGMFGFSVPVGRLSDRYGRRSMMLLGTTMLALGSVLLSSSHDWLPITGGTFLVGLGWCFVTVSSTALIADVVGPLNRGRAVGTSDSFSSAGAILLPVLGGPFVEMFDLGVLAIIGVGLMVVPFVLVLRLKETPGQLASGR
jgi:MFS family permease